MELFSHDHQKKVTVVKTYLLRLMRSCYSLFSSYTSFYISLPFLSVPLGNQLIVYVNQIWGGGHKKEERWRNMEIGDKVDKKTVVFEAIRNTVV